jgi:hypothetical protein
VDSVAKGPKFWTKITKRNLKRGGGGLGKLGAEILPDLSKKG